MRFFRKIFPFLMAVMLVAPTESFHFFSKIPAIIGHYQHHLEAHDEEQGFLNYLASHLSGDTDHHTDHAEDHESPFHHHEQECCAVQLIAPFPRPQLMLTALKGIPAKKINPYQSPSPHSDFLSAIWQPPKVS